MADQEIHNPKDYSETLRKLLTTDPSHADTFNPLFERLINNDAYFKAFVEGILAASTGHKHSGADGDGSKIPIANIDVPVELDGIVTGNELTNHINERNPHGTRAVDVGAPTAVEFSEHQANYTSHVNDISAHGDTLSVYRSSKDANGIFTTIEYKRADATLAKSSVLSGGTSPQYTTRTVTYYGVDGTMVLPTKTLALTYTGDDLTSEVLV